MNELQLKLERRRKSMADMESGARLDEAVNSQKVASGGSSSSGSSAQNEMLAKLERRRRLNEQGGSTDNLQSLDSAADTASAPVPQETAQPLPDPPPENRGIVDSAGARSIESTAPVTGTELDSSVIPQGRPPVSVRNTSKGHRAPPPVPGLQTPASPSAPDMAAISLDSPPAHNSSLGSSAAAFLVLPWNSGIHSLRERKTPDKVENLNAGLNEAHAKQHRRRKSVKMKLLSSDFDVDEALRGASEPVLIAILNELQLELGPGAYLLSIRKMHGLRAVSKLRDMNASPALLSNIILDLASEMGIDAYKEVVEQHHINVARDAAMLETPRGSESALTGDLDPSETPFPFMVCCHETGKWSIPEEAIRRINDIALKRERNIQLKVIGAVGAVRKGKSYFLNRVAGKQKGFGVGDDATPSCTEGIWIWFQPDSNIVLLDTAGMFDSRRRNKKLDEQLFLCTAVLSSLLIHNTTGSVDQHALCDFSNSSGLAKKLFRKQQKPRRGAQPKPEGTLPPLMWLIRDFSMSLSHYDGSCDAYLQKQLQPVKDDYTDNLVTVMNEARETIKCLFPVVSCVTMSKPFVSKEMLSHLDCFPFHSLPADFQLSANLAAEAARVSAPLKTFLKLPVDLDEELPRKPDEIVATPKVLLFYAESLCEVFNGGLSLDLNDMWDFVKKREEQVCHDAISS